MNIYICDDEKKIVEDIAALVAVYCKDCHIEKFHLGTELVASLLNEACDILLLDIDMPGMSGMEVAKGLAALKKKPLLIFVTSHDELVYESFQYHPYGFVRKRFYKEELPKLLNECESELKKGQEHFSFRAEGKDVRLLISEIMYFEAEANYLWIYTNDCEYRFRSTLTAVDNLLKSAGFIRIHKGFLVNQKAVRTINSEEAELVDGTRLPMGKTYVEEARRELMRYMR